MNKSSFSLEGKTILITGASSGIGFSTAIQCASVGARIIVIGRNEKKMDALMETLDGSGHEKIITDLTNHDKVLDLVEKIRFIDGVVHCAGIVEPFPIQFLSKTKIDQTFTINFFAPVEITGLLLKKRKLNEGASLVFISSIASQNPFKGGTAYSTSKSALESFSRTIAIEYANKKIRSNCISPAMVKTRIYDQVALNFDQKSLDEHIAKYPLGVGYPEDIANAVIFLLSPASRWITGINLRMDGGLLIESH